METSKRLKLTEEAIQQLQEGISLIFSRWREIQDAINLGFGGPYTREKAFAFASSVFNFFIQPNRKRKEPVYIDDLEDLLCEGLESLCLKPADDIVDELVSQVAEKLMMMHEECLNGKYQSIERLRNAMPVPYVIQAIKDVNDDDDEDNDELYDDARPSMIVDSSDNPQNYEVAPQDMEVDEWVTVTRRKNKGRKKYGRL